MNANLRDVSDVHALRPIPKRGETAPHFAGRTPDGAAISLRDFYMRRNLAIVFVGNDATGAEWLFEAAAQRDAAAQEVGAIVAVVPEKMDTHGLTAVVDSGGDMRARYGLKSDDLPAIFITDRYLTVFAANRGSDAVHDLDPTKIPEWLEFISCRCT
jgi:hypothetical protein